LSSTPLISAREWVRSYNTTVKGLFPVEELKRRAAALDDDVQKLTGSVDRLADRMNRSDRDRRWFVVGLIVVAIVVTMIGWIAVEAARNSRAQAQLRSEVLCPLYGIFLGAYDPNSRNGNPDPAAREKYEDAYAKIRRGWAVMECTDPIVPPRTVK
jgi:hypothetical protein